MSVITEQQEETQDALRARLAETERLLAERTAALDTLHQSTLRLQEAQRVAKIGSWEYDVATNRVAWSPEMFRLLGFDPADGEPDHETLLTHYDPEDIPLHDRMLLQALDDGLPYEYDIRLLQNQELIRWGHIVGQAVRGESGAIVRLVGTLMDISERKQAEEENARLAAIVESSHDAVLGTTLDGTLVSWNTGAERLYGYLASEIIGQHVSVLAPLEKREFWAAILQVLQRGEVCENVVVRRRRKDETWVDLVLTFSPIRNSSGAMVGVAAICRDITAQRRAEEAVRRSEARLAEAQRIAHIGSWEVDAQTGAIAFSEEMYALFELEKDSAIPPLEELLAHYHPEDVAHHTETVGRAMADCQPFETDTRIVRRSGEVRWCHIVGEPTLDESGKLLRLAGTTLDITERILVEERFRVLFDFSSEAHFFLCSKGIIDCNQAALQMLRCTSKTELLALHPIHLSPERQPDGSLSSVKGHLMEDAAYQNGFNRFEWTHKRLDGTDFPTEITLTPVILGGERAMLAVWHDLTERKEAEQRIHDYAVILEFQKKELEQVNRELCDLATTDGLTGLKNHRAFQERLAAECETAHRHGTPVSLLLLDVDHFKQYNDALGHPAGDAVLRQVAALLRQTIRDCDFAARYGGEEFVVILPQTNQINAIKAAERCRLQVEAADWECRAVTASFGVATLSLENPDGDSLIAAADQALYAAKFNGRNQVMSAGCLYLQNPPVPANLVILSA